MSWRMSASPKSLIVPDERHLRPSRSRRSPTFPTSHTTIPNGSASRTTASSRRRPGSVRPQSRRDGFRHRAARSSGASPAGKPPIHASSQSVSSPQPIQRAAGERCETRREAAPTAIRRPRVPASSCARPRRASCSWSRGPGRRPARTGARIGCSSRARRASDLHCEQNGLPAARASLWRDVRRESRGATTPHDRGPASATHARGVGEARERRGASARSPAPPFEPFAQVPALDRRPPDRVEVDHGVDDLRLRPSRLPDGEQSVRHHGVEVCAPWRATRRPP